MLRTPNLIRRWRLIYPQRFWAAVLTVAVCVPLLLFLVITRTITVTKSLDYPACEITYGEDLLAWDGDSDREWSDDRYHYVVKKFLVKSQAPKTIWTNVVESTPTRLSTGSLRSGTSSCQPDFNPLVDMSDNSYRWEGSRAVAVRLGTPDLGDVNDGGRVDSEDIQPRIDEAFTPPLYNKDYDRAAAWVDDGGQAVIKPDQGFARLLWCQSHLQPLERQSCGDITKDHGDNPASGAGYLFVEDNCPEHLECQAASSWYESGGTDLSRLVGVDRHGQLKPFRLYLDAVSTYGYQVGAGMNLTFKYPRITEVTNNLSLSKRTVNPGETVRAALSLGKIGPNLTKLEITEVNSGQLNPVENFQTDPSTITELNEGGQATLDATFKVNDKAKPGECYELSLKFAAESSVQTEGLQASISEVKYRYCIARPQTSATYTYEVESRGDVKSDMNEFKVQAAQTLQSTGGWSKAGVALKRVSSGGDFTLVLSSADQMTSFSTGCDSTYSCQTGRYVIINDDRWRMATPAWNKSGGNLRDYRHMAVNHEVGHWLGFGHPSCPAVGAKAPVMMQQSINLQGCKFNPWPTQAEIQKLRTRL